MDSLTEKGDLLWEVRAFIYEQFVETTRPPSSETTARHFDINIEETGRLYQALHDRHALLLDTDRREIRMANPFSGVPTDFQVHTNGKSYFANCAWDMLGIPAMLQSDAIIDAVCAESREPIRLEVRGGEVKPEEVRIHFPLPFARWYDDIAFT